MDLRGGGIHEAYGQGNELHETNVQAQIMILIIPLFLLHGIQGQVVPDEWALFAIYHWINTTNGCNANIYVDNWVMAGNT